MRIKNRKLRAGAEIGYSGLMLVVGVVLPVYFLKKTPGASHFGIFSLELLAVGGLGLQFIIYLAKSSKRPQELYLVGFLIAVPVVFLAVV